MISPLFSSIVLYSYDFFSSSATHSKCRGTTPLMSEVFNLFVLETIHENRFAGSCPQVLFRSINRKLFITLKCRIRYIFLT